MAQISGPESPRSSVDSVRSNASDSNLLARSPETLKLTFVNGLALVLGLQIGSGIFSAPSQVTSRVLSPGEGVLVWIFAGMLAWTGAASFVELGLAVPRNGGIQEYLQYCYGDFMGFLFTWTWIIIVKPCANAVIATVLADYLCTAVMSFDQTPLLLSKIVGVGSVVVISAINCMGASTGPQAANLFLILKLTLVLSIVLIGVTKCSSDGAGVPSSGYGWFDPIGTQDVLPFWDRFGDLVSALFGALFCYAGWESIGFVVGDMKSPTKNLPRVLHTSMSITVVSFVGMVMALYMCLPFEEIRSHTTLAAAFGQTVFGPAGKRIYSLAIAVSTLGALNTNIFANAKLCERASQRGYFPAILANLHFEPGEDEMSFYYRKMKAWPSFMSYPIIKFAQVTHNLRVKRGVPIYAILLNASMANVYVIVGTFNGLIVFVGISEYFFFFFCVIGVFIIRSRRVEAGDAHPYRAFTINPAVFILLSGLFVVRGVIANMLQGVALGSVALVGWITFELKSRRRGRAERPAPPP